MISLYQPALQRDIYGIFPIDGTDIPHSVLTIERKLHFLLDIEVSTLTPIYF